ncbi:MAG TPA: trypsin-like peptidase domain-containing protein [Ktedonobacteraceae bacterium]|jgi:hypothetical protein
MRLNSSGRRLSGAQIENFRSALHDAFDRDSFVDFLCIQLDKNIDDLTAKDTYPHELRNIIKRLDEQDQSAALLQGACLWRPTNAALAMFAQQFGLMPTPAITEVFESKVRLLDPDLDVSPWCAHLAALAPKICLIAIPSGISSTVGTGFLVGVDTVMTSFHVMHDVLAKKVDPTRVSLRFDYKLLEDGRTFSEGATYHLARETWCLDYSEFSPLDGRVHPADALPDADHLDYILLHVEGKPGSDPIGGTANKHPQPEKRGWIDLSSPPPLPAVGTELFILHHPDGKRLKMTLNTTSVQAVNSNGTRLLHQTNTANGTSGAPCFTYTWEPIALHQTGDPAADSQHPAVLNQSIPLATIWQRLARREMLRYLGNGQPEVPTPAPSPPAHEQAADPPGPPGALEQARAPAHPLQEPSSAEPMPADVEHLAPPSETKPPTERHSAHGQQAGGAHEKRGDQSMGWYETPQAPAMTADGLLTAEQAWMYLKETQHDLQEAMALFPNSQTYILPAKFDRAIRLLEHIAQRIDILKKALDETPALALAVKEHIGDMQHQFNIIFDQIEHYLKPAFYQRFPGNFIQLQAALNKVEQYFSREE